MTRSASTRQERASDAMSGTDPLAAARRVRNDALAQALRGRSLATHDAEADYSETVAKLRERFEADLADALARRIAAVCPAHRAFNAAMIRAEQAYVKTVRELAHSEG